MGTKTCQNSTVSWQPGPRSFWKRALVLLILLTSLFTSSVGLADEDPWLGPDKAKHFGASAVIAIGGYGLGVALFEDRTSALMLGGGLALTAGVGKEVYDATGHGSASVRDLVWDVAGTVTGLGVAWVVDWIVRGDRDDSSVSQPKTSFYSGAMTVRF